MGVKPEAPFCKPEAPFCKPHWSYIQNITCSVGLTPTEQIKGGLNHWRGSIGK